MREKLRALYAHRDHVTTVIFVVGVLIDIMILPDIDDPKGRYLGLAYLLGIALIIIFREWVVSMNKASKLEQRLYSASTFTIACLSGSALSFVCIYAFRSAALSVSWPLFLILGICIFANEFVATHGFRLTLDVGILLIATLFYIVFHLPVILKVSNDTTFAIGVAIAVVISLLYVTLLRRAGETAEHEAPKAYALALGIPLFVGMLYVLNLIPAVPLSLKDAGIYHNITRTESGKFLATYEEDERMFARFRLSVYHLTPADTGIYFFSAVDAPSELSAPLSHVWEVYDEQSKKWVYVMTVPFSIEGGRDSGYRAYSVKENIYPGLWRVTVKADQSRVVGRLRFQIVRSDDQSLKEIGL